MGRILRNRKNKKIDPKLVDAAETESRQFLEELIDKSFAHQTDVIEYLKNMIDWLADLGKGRVPYLYRIMPFVFALDVGITDQKFLRNVSNASFLGILISIINDRALDETDRQKYPLRWVYISFFLYSKYILIINEINEAIEDDAQRDFELLHFEKEAFIGLFQEDKLHFSFQLNDYTWDDVSFRCSQVKTLMFLISKKSNKTDLRTMNDFCNSFSFALGIQDDLSDWEEDFDNGRLTYAIQRAMTDQNIEYSRERHQDIKQKLCKTLFFSPVYFQITSEVDEALTKSAIHASIMSSELEKMALEVRELFRSNTLAHAHKLREINENFDILIKLDKNSFDN